MAPPDQFVLFGDSLAQGANDQSQGFALASELQNAYVRRMDVINRGYSGYNTTHALSVLEAAIPTPEQARMRFLTIWFGANDANPNADPIPQSVPIEKFKENLRAIVNHPRIKAQEPKIILLTPPPIEESVLRGLQEEWGYKGEIRRNEKAKEYAAAVVGVGREEGVEVLDVWGAFMKRAGWKVGDESLPGSESLGRNEVLTELLSDGLHLTPKGYKVVFDALRKLICEKWPDYEPYKMAYDQKVEWELNWEKEKGEKFWDVKNDN